MPRFVPGLELARAFYDEAIGPLLGDTEHAAALLGWGSDVLGFDTARSTDHGWGPRLQVFVERESVATVERAIEADLPDEFRGWRRASVGTRYPCRTTSKWLRSTSG